MKVVEAKKTTLCPECGRVAARRKCHNKYMIGCHGVRYCVQVAIYRCPDHGLFTDYDERFQGRKYIADIREYAIEAMEGDNTLQEAQSIVEQTTGVLVPITTIQGWCHG